MIRREKWEKIGAVLLYILPVMFFAVAYFGMTTTGEDIFQGAGNLRNGNEVDMMADVSDSFDHNGRITDMYAWSVIDLFDYQFQFGVDTVFRLFDVVMVSGLFYIMAYMVVGRRLKLEIKDAVVFCVLFTAVILTQHGRVFYAGFSAIHNYMIGAFIFILFVLPYAKLVLGQKVNGQWWMVIAMAVLGLIFGMSAALTPVAFMVTMAVCALIWWKFKKKIRLPGWAIMGIFWTIVGFLISNVLGPGAGNYSSNEVYTATYDYVALGEIFCNISRILKHLLFNFGRVLLPVLVLAVIMWAVCENRKQFFTKRFYKKIERKKCNLMVAEVMFAVILMLGSFQVNAPLRILLPAYLVLVVAVVTFFGPYVRIRAIGAVVSALVIALVAVKIILTVSYHEQSATVLKKIRNAEDINVCVEREEVKAYNFPIVYLGQEDMMAEWAMPELVYDKKVEFCREN